MAQEITSIEMPEGRYALTCIKTSDNHPYVSQGSVYKGELANDVVQVGDTVKLFQPFFHTSLIKKIELLQGSILIHTQNSSYLMEQLDEYGDPIKAKATRKRP
jgi:hypothetical protein